MADLNGRNNSSFLATDLGALTFGSNVSAPDTHTEFRIGDSVGSYSAITRFGGRPGDDSADNFSFLPSGVGTVTITINSLSSGTYAGSLIITPLRGVTKVEGDMVGAFYGGIHSYSNTRIKDAITGGAEAGIDLVEDGLLGRNVDVSGVTWSDGGAMSTTLTLDGSEVVFEITGYQISGSSIPSDATIIDLDEIYYSIEVTPQDRMFSEIGNGGLLFQDIARMSQTHTGSDAIDTYLFSGSRNDFRVEFDSGSSIGVSNASSRSTPDVLFNIERIQLNDGYLAFDTDGNAGQMYRLYQAAFDRDPDVAGLGHWIDTFDKGLFDLKGVAQEFLISEEFKSRFGTEETLDDDGFLTLLYNNVLDRDPDQAGFAFWSDQQDNGLSRADILQYFSESEENYANVAAEIDAGIFYL
jgi:hypothetical protein